MHILEKNFFICINTTSNVKVFTVAYEQQPVLILLILELGFKILLLFLALQFRFLCCVFVWLVGISDALLV